MKTTNQLIQIRTQVSIGGSKLPLIESIGPLTSISDGFLLLRCHGELLARSGEMGQKVSARKPKRKPVTTRNVARRGSKKSR